MNPNSPNFYGKMVLLAIAIVGFFVIYFFRKHGGGIYGYSLITASIIGIIIFEMASKKKNLNTKGFQAIFSMLKLSFPLFLIVSLCAWLLSLNIIYNNAIISDELPNEYHTFQNLSTILLMIQLYLIYLYITDPKLSIISKNVGLLITFTSFLMVIVIGIMQTIIQYFRTDG